MKTPWIDPRATAFIAYLQRYKNDRGALASLRSGLSEARRPNAWPFLGGFKGAAAIGDPAFETVAALWAHDPDLDSPCGNLGHTLARLKAENTSFEGRFKRLLTCDKEEIATRVVPIVLAAHAKKVHVNYPQLLSDLLAWSDRVQTEWAKGFWGDSELLDKEEAPQ